MTSLINYGMVGGGRDAFIGNLHRISASIDNHYHISWGSFRSDPESSIRLGNRLNIFSDRCYSDFKEMAVNESAREDGIEAVETITPNN